MEQREIVLGALASSLGAEFTPVQVQKLFFLLNKNISTHIGGPVFAFTPYDYGPFDQNVYHTLNQLALEGLVEIIDVPGRQWKKYSLTEAGVEEGRRYLQTLPQIVQDYIRQVSDYVRSLTFMQLVSAIYKNYPEMKVNSVFNK